jgi:hypothetical protein
VATCPDFCDKLVSWDNRLNDFRGHASERPAVLSYGSPEITRRVGYSVFFNEECAVRNLVTIQNVFDFEGPETPGKRLTDLIRQYV